MNKKQLKIVFNKIPVQNEYITILLNQDNLIEEYFIKFTNDGLGVNESEIGIDVNSSANNYSVSLVDNYEILENNIEITVVDNEIFLTIINIDWEFLDVYGDYFDNTSGNNNDVDFGDENLKYFLKFKDVKNILHEVFIYENDFIDFATEVKGRCSIKYSETEDILESIKGMGMTIELEASDSLNFSDLYSEEERTFKVSYIRDGVTIFNGWLSPEGLYQSFVTDKWLISLDCTDGLGFLKNLSYVDDQSGVQFSGKQSLMTIIINCLKRTKIKQNINTGIDIRYIGMPFGVDVLKNVFINVDRFVKEDNNTIMNCDEVLRSVLEPFGASLTQLNGEWYIYKANNLFNKDNLTFFNYDYLGVIQIPNKKTVNFKKTIGSDINGFYPHHVNENQQTTINSSVGAFRINYKYGFVKDLLSNPNMENVNGDLYGWDVQPTANITLPEPSGFGVNMQFSNSIPNGLNIRSTDIINVNVNDGIEVSFLFDVKFPDLNGIFKYQVFVTDVQFPNQNAVIWQLQPDLSWEVVSSGLEHRFNNTSSVEINLKPQPIPIDGFLYINVSKPQPQTYIPTENEITLTSVNVTPSEENTTVKEGENHTFQRENKPSSKISDIKEVYNGDNPSDVYIGTVYKRDENTPTDYWSRNGKDENKPILQIMGEERMRMYQRPSLQFSGSIFGYLPYLSKVNIDGFSNVFTITSYNYDAINNITDAVFMELLNEEIDDIDYKVTIDYGNVVEPTIKG